MKRLLAAVLPLALLCASAAAAATLTATPATYWDLTRAAKGGDIVQLSTGDYGDLTIWNMTPVAPGVVIQPAPGAAVKLSSINANGSTNLLITGFDVTMTPTTGIGLSAGSGAKNIVFDHLKVHQADAATLAGVGFAIRNAANITVQNSEFYWTGSGGYDMDSDRVTVTGNLIHDINTDGILLAGATNATVTKNVLHDFHPGDGDHPDAIQWWSTADTATKAVEIAFNHIERGAGGISQGIFGEDGANVSIHDNELLGTMYNGIGLSRTKGAVIDHNFVDGYPDMGTRIIVRGGCDQVAITNNAAQAVVNYVASDEPPCTNVTIAGNTTLQPAAMGDLSLLTAWKGTVAPPVVTPPPVVVPPVVTPPAVNPLQATVDSLNAQLASLTAKVASLTAQLQTATTLTATQASQIATLKAQLATCQAKLTKGRAALK